MSSLVRLSQSDLWERQRQYYHETGVEAWNSGTVPHYITNNPVIANAYADLIAAHIDDLAQAGELDLEKPVHVVEMGGGSGRLAFLILRRLEALARVLPVKVRYVLTDFTTTNLGHWREHPSFAAHFAEGRLDLAQFDVENDTSLHLEVSDETIDSSGNPVFFVANYLFDSLTQDCFNVENGVLNEAIPQITYQDGTSHIIADVEYSFHPAGETPYARPDYDEILEQYRERLGHTSFLFPVGPLKCLEALQQISGGRTCLITADKAWSRWEDLVGVGDPSPVTHGSFSLTVNFHAMGLWWEGQGGRALHTAPRDSSLQISCFLMGLPEPRWPRTMRVFEEKIDGSGPLDFFLFRESLSASTGHTNFRFCLEMLRLSAWDPEILFELSGPLSEVKTDDLSTLNKRELFVALARIWSNYFFIGETRDIPFEVARILFRLEYYEQSLSFYEESLRLFGPHKMTHYNMGLCHYYLRRLDRAKESFEKSLALDPGYGVARDWLLRLRPEIEESGTFPAVALV